MRLIIISIISFFLVLNVHGQTASEFQRSSPRMLAYKNLPGDENTETVQTNFINQTWRNGIVYFRNTVNKFEGSLLFDVYSNQLYFLKDSMIMEFTQPVKEFFIDVIEKKDTVNLHFRSGYPSIHRNADNTFYEVLVDGGFQLLKCKAKTIGLYKDKDIPEDQRDYAKQLLYGFLPNGKIIQVKTDKDYILKTLPEYSDSIKKICVNQKLKLKNEAQLKELFLALNR